MQSAPPARATHPAPRARQALTDLTLMADAPTPAQLAPERDLPHLAGASPLPAVPAPGCSGWQRRQLGRLAAVLLLLEARRGAGLDECSQNQREPAGFAVLLVVASR